MKIKFRILLVLFVLLQSAAFAAQPYSTSYLYGNAFQRLSAYSSFTMPYKDTVLITDTTRAGSMVMRPADNKVYVYNGTYWTQVGCGCALEVGVTQVNGYTNGGIFWSNASGIFSSTSDFTWTGTNVVINGGVVSSSYSVTAGTSSQFLKANGTVDNNSYANLNGAVFTAAVQIPQVSASDQSGISYTFALTDAGKFVTSNNASPVTFTVPPSSSVAFASNTYIMLENVGAGKLTIAAGVGVTIQSDGGFLSITQYRSGYLHYRGGDTWVLSGGISN